MREERIGEFKARSCSIGALSLAHSSMHVSQHLVVKRKSIHTAAAAAVVWQRARTFIFI
jgi:hypothetical protein